jgi:hypothetical protein
MAEHDPRSSGAASPRRRGFLLTLGTGGVAAVAAAIKPISDATPELQESAAQAGQGYRETEHIRDYYRTTKI